AKRTRWHGGGGLSTERGGGLRQTSAPLRRPALPPPALLPHELLAPPVLLTAGRRIVVDDRELRAVALGLDALRGDATGHQEITYGVRALLRELDVEALVADVVAEALDQYVAPGIRLEKVGQLVDAPLGAGADLGLTGSEQHVADREHHAAIGLLRLEALELLGERRRFGVLGGERLGLGVVRLFALVALGRLRRGVGDPRFGRAAPLLGLACLGVRLGAGSLQLAVALLQEHLGGLTPQLLHLLLGLGGGARHRSELGLALR